jgi:two-component system, chemotaxis family, chemotaxis protein CheY
MNCAQDLDREKRGERALNMVKPNPRILIVDDFETVLVLFHKALNDLGIDDVVEAEDGMAALQLLDEAYEAKKPFDVIFCDWNMPNMNGLDLLNLIRKSDKYAKLPFVMVTANSDETEVVDAMRAGVSEYLIKPFDAKSLGRTIHRVLARYKAVA